MSFINNNLTKNEEVTYKTSIHWFIYMFPLILFISGVGLIYSVYFTAKGDTLLIVLGTLLVMLSPIMLIRSLITVFTTELALTNRRVIAKRGFVKRSIVDLEFDKLESVTSDQSIFGRVFGYGNVIVKGTGGGSSSFPGIDNPLEFRKKVLEREVDGH